jgi:hypothetical protein
LLAAACTAAWTAASAQEMARYPLVFGGPQGLEVVVAPIEGDKEALVRVSGINHAIDKVVFLARSQARGTSGQDWVTQIDGRDFALVQKQSSGYGGERYVAYLPGQRDGVPLRYDEPASKRLAPAGIKASYLSQKKNGVQDKLARFDRDKRVAQIQAGLAEKDADASRACGAPVKTTVDWQSIDEDKLKRLSIQGFCGTVASALDSMCRNQPDFKPKAAALGQISCQFGPELKLRTEGGRVVFTTREDAPNQDDFAQQFLRNQ